MRKTIFTLTMAFIASTALFAATITSETFNPTKDGFVKQSDGAYVDTYENMELSSYSAQNREIFFDFNLTSMTIVPQHAFLKVYVNSVSTTVPFIVGVYGQTGNVITESLTFANRPVAGQRCVDIHAAQDSVGKWLQFDVSDFVKAQNYSTNKLLSFRIALISPSSTSSTSPLITIGSKESTNMPQLVLSDTPVPGIYEVPYAGLETLFASVPFAAAGNPTHAFSGVGLLPEMKHVTAGDNMAWRNSSGTYPVNLMVKFKDAININKLRVWNMNWLFGTGLADYTDRGVKGVNLYVSTSGEDMTTVALTDAKWKKVSADGYELTRATASTSYQGQVVSVTGAENVRWFAFNILSNFAGTNYVGLSEVKIYKEIKAIIDTPTGVTEFAKSSIVVSSENGILKIDNIAPASCVQLYTMQGQLIRSELSKGANLQIQVPTGVYVVKANGMSVKAVTK